MSGANLECSHCGCVAVTSSDRTYREDMAFECKACSFPGHVAVDEEPDEAPVATWVTHDWEDSARCSQQDCNKCPSYESRADVNALRVRLRAAEDRARNDDLTLALNQRACKVLDKREGEALDEAAQRITAQLERAKELLREVSAPGVQLHRGLIDRVRDFLRLV